MRFSIAIGAMSAATERLRLLTSLCILALRNPIAASRVRTETGTFSLTTQAAGVCTPQHGSTVGDRIVDAHRRNHRLHFAPFGGGLLQLPDCNDLHQHAEDSCLEEREQP